ncbi:methyltransferase domain protein [Lyngbya aestuarii BL J]|uniref:Methyltransferase domain protein n=1 Tax=Lyngbya aestuarii BL J TaxID=1348334 RepID=U7QGQ0_9CYAN|nr:class I SAM-dependent methyltransferase [Lyngbya aestuarii]ERT07149.1 methyltransferase domain protein [Lyngbya aestuarii BL J]
MGFYSRVILPRLLDWTMADPAFTQYRQQVLANVEGEILEIGFGTGLNLSYYPHHIEKITTIDPNSGMNKLAQKRIQASKIKVENRILNSESLPMADSTFDSVVSTWTLCSIAQVETALQEIYRVLKPGGKFFFVEHGLSDQPQIQVWQNRLTPLQKIIADGCHLNRNIQRLVEQQFQEITLDKFDIENFPKVGSYTYMGVATKTN